MENEVDLYCLENDLSLVQSLIPNVVNEFQKCGIDSIKINVNDSEFLPTDAYI